MPGPKTLRNVRIAAVLAVVALLATSHFLGILQHLGDPQGLARTLVELGPWGYAAFIAAYTLLQPFGVPGTVFVMAAPLIWPWQEAFALSMVGTMSASVVGFSFARLVARDWISGLIPPRFRKYEAALESRGFTTVLVLRFLFWMPPLLHAFFGVSRVGFLTHFWGSLVGYLVPLFVVSYFGQQIFETLQSLPHEAWLAAVVIVAFAVLATWGVRRARRARMSS